MASAQTTGNNMQNVVSVPPNERGTHHINVGENERIISILLGGPLALFGLTRGSMGGLVWALLGGGMIYRGVRGHSYLYELLGLNTVKESPDTIANLPGNQGIKVERAVTINCPADELYRFWRNFENAPRFMKDVESVQVIDNSHSHWMAKTPLGTTIEWDAEVIDERENRLISWRANGWTIAPSAGTVRFEPATGGRGTVARLELEYKQLKGPIGTALAKFLGKIPENEARDDMRNFKELMEAGEIATTKGQPTGQRSFLGRMFS